MTVVLKYRVPRPMSRPIGGLLADRGSSCRPDHAGLFVPYEDRLGRGIQDGIIRPLGQAVPLAVSVPGESRPRFADDGPEDRIGKDIHPGGRRIGVGAQIDGVLPPIGGETAKAVEIRQLQERKGGRRVPG